MNPSELITVIIPTSPIPLHPSTALIETAIDSIRKHLPGVEILIQCDGVRAENENRREQYEEFKRRLLGLCCQKYQGVLPILFPEFKHQAEMLRESFEYIKTPLLFYEEGDWRILDRPIDWDAMANAILNGQLNHIRLCRWEEIHPAHEYLMDGHANFDGLPVVLTHQWSGHPALASVEFYKQIIGQFRVGCRTLIEEFIYGPVVNAPWSEYKCAIYAPDEGGYKRIEHTDGRQADPKFDAIF
jgi:hypothetical protein